MSSPLMRKDLAEAMSGTLGTSHAGLWLSRGWAHFSQAGEGRESAGKSAHIGQLCRQKASDLYRHAYERWKEATADPARFQHCRARLLQRMFIGMSGESALETGVCTSHTYGMPLIPGSSVKGAVRAHAVAMGVTSAYLAALFGEAEADGKDTQRMPGAGSVIWHDAWWMPDADVPPFVAEIVTVHHMDYYAGQGEATDFDSPVPNVQVAVQGSFHFVMEGDPAWARLAGDLLRSTLADAGLGAKRAAGYGVMEVDLGAERRAEEARRKAAAQRLSPVDRLRIELELLNENQLARKFGTELNATRKGYSEQDWALVKGIALEVHGPLIQSWAGETQSTNKNRAKAYRFFAGPKGED